MDIPDLRPQPPNRKILRRIYEVCASQRLVRKCRSRTGAVCWSGSGGDLDEAETVKRFGIGVFGRVVHDSPPIDAGDLAEGNVWAPTGESVGFEGFAADGH